MAAAPANRTRTLLLVGVLAVLAAWLLTHWAGSGSGAGSGTKGDVLAYQGRNIPVLETARMTPPPEPAGGIGRNPFGFGVPPTPTPAPTLPPPSPRPTLPPRPTPTPRWVEGPNGGRLPPPPPFNRQFIGAFGPERLTVAVFRRNDQVDVAIPGMVLDNTFIVRQVGYESVTIGFVGYPESEDVRVPLEAN